MEGPSGLLAAGGLIGGLLLLVYLTMKFGNKTSRSRGRAEGINEATEEFNRERTVENEKTSQENAQIVQEVEKTHEVHDRLDADPAYRNRVRDRFTRD